MQLLNVLAYLLVMHVWLNVKNQVLRKPVKLHSSQNVNQNLVISTIQPIFWCRLVLIVMINRLIDLKHQHLAGAFFLALIQDNNFE